MPVGVYVSAFILTDIFLAPEELIHSPGQSGCPTPGCKGIGHIKGAKYIGHHRYI